MNHSYIEYSIHTLCIWIFMNLYIKIRVHKYNQIQYLFNWRYMNTSTQRNSHVPSEKEPLATCHRMARDGLTTRELSNSLTLGSWRLEDQSPTFEYPVGRILLLVPRRVALFSFDASTSAKQVDSITHGAAAIDFKAWCEQKQHCSRQTHLVGITSYHISLHGHCSKQTHENTQNEQQLHEAEQADAGVDDWQLPWMVYLNEMDQSVNCPKSIEATNQLSLLVVYDPP